jgi:hypothetical protein
MGLLQKISWKTRRWNLKFNLLDIYLHDGDHCWGFSFCEVIKDHRPYSLFSFEFRLPNGANVKSFTVDNWDFLFVSTPLFKKVSDLDENIMWGYQPTRFEKILIKIGNKLYR